MNKTGKGKQRWDLLDLSLLDGAVDSFTVGAEKYFDRGYREVENRVATYQAAFMRHYRDYQKDNQSRDKDDGILALDHAICNLIILREFVRDDHGV